MFDGVKFVALWVDDATYSFNETVKRGAKPYLEPTRMEDEFGEIIKSGIHTYGETIHYFIERKNYKGVFMPGFRAWNPAYKPSDVGLKYVDHMVGNVELGQMNKWVDFYKDVMGFRQLISFDDKEISTEYTALMSKVVANGNDRISTYTRDDIIPLVSSLLSRRPKDRPSASECCKILRDDIQEWLKIKKLVIESSLEYAQTYAKNIEVEMKNHIIIIEVYLAFIGMP